MITHDYTRLSRLIYWRFWTGPISTCSCGRCCKFLRVGWCLKNCTKAQTQKVIVQFARMYNILVWKTFFLWLHEFLGYPDSFSSHLNPWVRMWKWFQCYSSQGPGDVGRARWRSNWWQMTIASKSRWAAPKVDFPWAGMFGYLYNNNDNNNNSNY